MPNPEILPVMSASLTLLGCVGLSAQARGAGPEVLTLIHDIQSVGGKMRL